jgi:hypothetical protein
MESCKGTSALGLWADYEQPRVEAPSGWHGVLVESLPAGAEYGNIATGVFTPVLLEPKGTVSRE